jgi:hydroxymethylglutaryl-CoA reductase (NADPH)
VHRGAATPCSARRSSSSRRPPGAATSHWVDENIDEIRRAAEATTSVGKLLFIDPYLANKFAFCASTSPPATRRGRTWSAAPPSRPALDPRPVRHGGPRFYLESNFATDKKASQVNMMRTRGKRVTAEAVIKREVLSSIMRVEPENLAYHYGVANVGSILSGANNNGLHSANAITAMFIATGQDVANVAESSAASSTPSSRRRDLYLSITIPSLIVATYGGGTGLATQRECLELLGCYGRGTVNKFAEIVAGGAGRRALAGQRHLERTGFRSHEQYGRNR